jgi:hypothetical protein
MKLNLKEKIIIAGAGASLVILAIILIVGRNKKAKKLGSEAKRLKSLAEDDLNKWKGKKETDPSVSDTLVGYWNLVGKNFSPSQMQSSSFQSGNPWSSAYVSHLITNSGFENFKPRSFHSTYVVDSKENKTQGKKSSFWAYRPADKKVEEGDIIVKNRGRNYTYDTIVRGVPTHGDVVIDLIEKNGTPYAVIQGGNVSNSVTRAEVKLNTDRTLPSNYIAHLKYEK